jgi:type 1 glutamine amidotransferase
MNNFAFFRGVGVAAAIVALSFTSRADDTPKKILFFSKSSGFQHDMIKESKGEKSKAQKVLEDLGAKNNFEFTFTKDGGVFTPENIAKYDAFFFYTTGDLTELGTDKNPGMPKGGKEALLDAIAHGKGFIGTHSAADTFHSPGGKITGPGRWHEDGANADPYVKMLGGEFIVHGTQQAAHQICVDHNFPGMSGAPDDFGPKEEWYSLKDFAPNLHVLLVQDTSTMKKEGGDKRAYDRPNYPSTWAHLYGPAASTSDHGASKLESAGSGHPGRVFYTSMGHRDDIWTNSVFQQVIVGALNWVTGRVDADVTPNLKEVAPQADVLPPAP